ncbi:MAG: PQQ-dependent sugar dehydrogenase [Sphingomonadales bacterium]
MSKISLKQSSMALIIALTPTLAEADRENGKKLYTENCAACHGEDLEGAIGSSFIDKVWNYGTDPQLIGMNIKFGIPNLEMPAWENILSDNDIGDLVGYIMDVEKKSTMAAPTIQTHNKTNFYNLKIEVLDDSLNTPWAIEFLDNNTGLVTDRAGQLYILENDKLNRTPIKNTPKDVAQGGQAGLFDIVVDPDFTENGWIYMSYAHAQMPAGDMNKAKAITKIIRGKIMNNIWSHEEVLYEADPKFYTKGRAHFGARIAIKDNYLFFSIGDRGVMSEAQDITKPNGKIHRINKDGSIPNDNPFLGTAGALPTIFSYGHRNPQGLSIHPETGEIWNTEHGPMGGDELNLVKLGNNYGWPKITYGRNYDGKSISDLTKMMGMEQPKTYWVPSIAVFDNDFYEGAMFPKWTNDLLVTSLKYRDLRRLKIEGDKITEQEVILKGLGRMRSVNISPDGAIYAVLNEPPLIIKLTRN